MAIDSLSYTGINRAYSDFAGTRACEELINLRPTSDGVVPVKEALERMSNVPYYKVFIHHTTSGPKYIAIGRTNADVYAKHLVYDEEQEIWTVADTLFSVSAANPTAAAELLDKVYYATAGNILVFSICGDTVHENRAFTWTQGGYQRTEADIPPVTFTVSDGTDPICVTEDIQDINKDTDPNEVVSVIESGFNAMQEKNPEVCFGPVIIAMAFKTKDGNTFWTNDWRVYDPTNKVSADTPPFITYAMVEDTIPEYQEFFQKYDGYGYIINNMNDITTFYVDSLNEINGYGTKVTLSFPRLTSGWNKDTSIIESVEIYSSRPVLYMDTSAAYEGFKWFENQLTPGRNAYVMILPRKETSDMDLGGQLLYHQATIMLASLAESAQEVVLNFGGNVQMSEDTLDTDAGAIKRYGRILSYNARFHYYDSVSHIDVGMPSFRFPARLTHNLGTMDVFVRYADSERSEFLWAGSLSNIEGVWPADVVIAPTVNIKEVVTYTYRNGTYYTTKYRMHESSTYNFSICDTGPYTNPQTGRDTSLEALIPSGGTPLGITLAERDAINVSEQYNPFVFLVEHSYKAPGNILDVQTQMAGITDTSYGRDPLNVFTERGTYALTQGSANVLYGTFLPVSNSVISRKGGSGSLPTEMGVFFLADGALWLLTGRRATLISDALHLGPHKYIRDCEGYKKISGGGVDTPEYDVANLVSSVTFEEYVRSGGRLGFNRFRMELYVSNKAYNYTYVLSLKYRQWFKVGKCLWQDDPSGNLISTPGENGLMTILDLSTETDGNVLVHLQSRPFSMGYRYIHMHRIVSMVRARLSAIEGEKIVVGLYGSDDLQNWKLLAYAKRTGTDAQTEDDPPVVTGRPLKVSQIRTTPSSRSWRYYTICIGGIVPTDTDLGPVIVDYEPVVRRIG